MICKRKKSKSKPKGKFEQAKNKKTKICLRFPGAICGKRSVLGVVQFTPFRLRVAFVNIVGLSAVVNAQTSCSFSAGK